VRLLADEGVDAATVARLRLDGHDVTYVAELAPGITDDGVLVLANGEGRVLLTIDKDFGELVFRLRRVSAGVLLVRLAGRTSSRAGRTVGGGNPEEIDMPVALRIELEPETDGRWIAEVVELPGVLACRETQDEAIAHVQALALRVIADRLEHDEAGREFLNITFAAA
jgi:predicted RNase H-like HicB family nuclease/predicted nuclease of predicted toxin-antitoxin system